MPVYEVKIVIPVTIQADNSEEAIQLAQHKIIVERKDLRHSQLSVEEPPKQISMF